jgi:hypothetical protein
MSVIMIAIAAGSVLISHLIRRRASDPLRVDPIDLVTARYVAQFGLISNWLFLGIIIVQCVPILFYLGSC